MLGSYQSLWKQWIYENIEDRNASNVGVLVTTCYIAKKKNVFPYRLNSNRRRVFHFTKLLLKICTVSEIRRVELYFINNWRDQTTSTSQLEEMYNCLFVGISTWYRKNWWGALMFFLNILCIPFGINSFVFKLHFNQLGRPCVLIYSIFDNV